MKRAPVIISLAVIAGIAVLYLLFAAGYLTQSQASELTVDQIQAQAITVSYSDLVRNNAQYVGKIVYFRGQVTRIFDTPEGFTVVLMAVKDPSSNVYYENDIVWLDMNGPQLNEGNFIEIWGRVDGMETYKTAQGAMKTLPEITVLYGDFAT